MVHISLPHRNKDKGKPAVGDLHPDQNEQRPSPLRSPSQHTIANGGEKPLILKIYVIRVGSVIKHLAADALTRSTGSKPCGKRQVWDQRSGTCVVLCKLEQD